MKTTKFLYTILLSTMVLFTACEEDSEDDPDGGGGGGEVLCDNGFMDANETGIDCDADSTTFCPPCEFCGDGLLSSVLLDDDESGMYEYDVDCGTPECGTCTQELFISAIGELGSTSPFRDQYSYNRLLAAAGQDTLELDPILYPGLKVEKFVQGFFGLAHLKVTANQGVMTDSAGIFMKTVTMYIPLPEDLAPTNPYLGPPITVGMSDEAGSVILPGGCYPFVLGSALPIIFYKEELIGNPALMDRCFYSYLEEGDNSELSINHLLGYIEGMYYVKGEVNTGSLIHSTIGLPGMDDVLGEFNGIDFKAYYPYIL